MRPPLWRRALSACIDALLGLLVVLIWQHWSTYPQYHRFFGRPLSSDTMRTALLVLPLSLVLLEAIRGRGPGKAVTRLRVAGGVGRRFLRAVLKWSPILIGPLAWVLAGEQVSEFVDERISPMNVWLYDHAGPLRQVANAVGLATKALNVGLLAVVAIGIGSLGMLTRDGRTLHDRIAGTRVVRK